MRFNGGLLGFEWDVNGIYWDLIVIQLLVRKSKIVRTSTMLKGNNSKIFKEYVGHCIRNHRYSKDHKAW